MERNNVPHQIQAKLLYLYSLSFALQEFFPSLEQILKRDDIMEEITMKTPPQRLLLPVLEKIKGVYILWHGYHLILPRVHRNSLGDRIDILFTDLVEAISSAAFNPKEDRVPYVQIAIRKLETIRFFLLVLWETKSLDNKKYIAISLPLEEVGKMLGGWRGQLIKQNSPK